MNDYDVIVIGGGKFRDCPRVSTGF